jgi:hypothetical protein
VEEREQNIKKKGNIFSDIFWHPLKFSWHYFRYILYINNDFFIAEGGFFTKPGHA